MVEGPRICEATGCRVDTCKAKIRYHATVDHEIVRLECELRLLVQSPSHTRLSDLLYVKQKCSLETLSSFSLLSTSSEGAEMLHMLRERRVR